MKLTLLIALIIVLALVIVQNTAPVYARFLLFTTEMPIFVLLFLMATGGFIAGLFYAFVLKSKINNESMAEK